jgi:chemotaxis protein MotB
MSIQTFTNKELELDQDALKSDLSKVTLARDKWLADYGALSNKMDVMQESYNALEKTVALQINMSKIVICYRN